MRRLHEIIEDQKAKTGRAQDFRIAYEHIASGGLRPRAHDIAPSVKAFGKISFHNYADYAMGAGFQFGFTRLRELGSVRRSAIRPMI